MKKEVKLLRLKISFTDKYKIRILSVLIRFSNTERGQEQKIAEVPLSVLASWDIYNFGWAGEVQCSKFRNVTPF